MMRKFLLLFLGIGICFPLFAATETVSTISFNPSRLGQYTYLKVNKDINLKGGLQISDQTHLNTPASDTGELVFAASNGGTINITSDSSVVLEIPAFGTKSGANTGVSINMPNTIFQKTTSAAVPNVEMSGGTMNMSSSETSTITTLSNTAGGMVLSSTETLLGRGNIVISGDTSAGTNSGMTLGKIRVPKPSITFAKYCWKKLEGADGALKVFAVCTSSDTDYVNNTPTPSYSWTTSGMASGIVNFKSSTHNTSQVNYWYTQVGAESRTGETGSDMWIGKNDNLSRILEAAFNGNSSATNTTCQNIYSVDSSAVVTTKPTGTCTSKNAKKVLASSEYSTDRNKITCELLECK